MITKYFYDTSQTTNDYIAYQLMIWWVCQTSIVNGSKEDLTVAYRGDLDTVTADGARTKFEDILEELYDSDKVNKIISIIDVIVEEVLPQFLLSIFIMVLARDISPAVCFPPV